MEITVELVNVTACATPLYVAVELAMKLVPLIVRVCDADPACSEVGENDVMLGTGLVGLLTVWPPERVPLLPPKAGGIPPVVGDSV